MGGNTEIMSGMNEPIFPTIEFSSVLDSPARSVKDFYSGSTILLTGGSGFLGKVFLEKVLRSCPGVKTVYVLMRGKRGQGEEQRFKELLKNQVFDNIRSKDPALLDKLVCLSGDVCGRDLSLSEQDLSRLRESVSVVIHSAATIRFTEPLKDALTLNTLGTKHVMELCKTFTLLKSIVYVSTAYCNSNRVGYVEEKVYPTAHDAEALTQCAQLLPAETFELIAPQVQGKHPNTYTLTKALAEQLVAKYCTELPVCIVRPSIVGAAVKDPFPGWIDNMFGATGMTMEIYRGSMRTAVCNPDYIMDIVPVDFTVNTCLVAAWHHLQHRGKEVTVYNCTSSLVNPVKWGEFADLVVDFARHSPSKYLALYPNFKHTPNRMTNLFWEVTTHYLPSFLMDLLLRAQGKKPIMMKIARRFKLATDAGSYFAMREWTFAYDNMKALVKSLEDSGELEEFPCLTTGMDWKEYVWTYTAGIRKYLLKDGPESLTAARRKLQRLFWFQKCLQAVSGYYTYKVLFGRR